MLTAEAPTTNPHFASSGVPSAGQPRGPVPVRCGRTLASPRIGLERAQAENGGSLALFTPLPIHHSSQLPTPN